MKKVLTLMGAVLVVLSVLLVSTVPALACGSQGCTPGYWKNNAENFGAVSWVPTGYSPSQTLESVFNVPDSLGLDDVTLLQALSFQGGPGVLGASQIALRVAVASLLNAAHPDVDWATNSPQEVIGRVNCWLATGDRDIILSWANTFDGYNNAGCSIDQYGNPIVVAVI